MTPLAASSSRSLPGRLLDPPDVGILVLGYPDRVRAGQQPLADNDRPQRLRIAALPRNSEAQAFLDGIPADLGQVISAAMQIPRSPGFSLAAAREGMDLRQRSALAEAIASGDAEQVIQAARDAVREWSDPDVMWPDHWRLWQQALDDALPPDRRVDLHDLAGAPRPEFYHDTASPEMRAAWDLGHMPAEQIPGAVAALVAADVLEIRDVLGFQSPGFGIDLGPHAGLAYEACTWRLRAEDGQPAELTWAPDPARTGPGEAAGQPHGSGPSAASARLDFPQRNPLGGGIQMNAEPGQAPRAVSPRPRAVPWARLKGPPRLGP